ncbi:MAG: heparinase II/III family protein [Candidatus Krumholzibacteria bacterium]|nr:heparinase II/III family protein [Candidatus Krumholzibacteria bacterium]
MRLLTGPILLTLVFFAMVAPAGAQDPGSPLGNHHESPVYYEVHETPFFLAENKTLLHEDKLKLWHFPVVDVAEWDWVNGGINDFSWWMQVEELRFLLPLLKSGDVSDRDLAREWFESWYESNLRELPAGHARWRGAMSAAYRGMVLVYFLKTEELRDDSNDLFRSKLRESIHQHQEFLVKQLHFNSMSNHGLVIAFGLLEVTRVFPNTEFELLGLDRLIEMASVSVSEAGTHLEHSPNYHFVFLDWMDGYMSYLSKKPYLDQARVSMLVDYVIRMKKSAYYLQDHDGTIPTIGDADSLNVADRWPRFFRTGRKGAGRVLNDAEAGYAIYKDARRFVVFAIQDRPPKLGYHYHNDALSVYYRHNGETILGDPGKYQHTRSGLRSYFISMPAHNTVFPTRLGKRIVLAGELKMATGNSHGDFGSESVFTSNLKHSDFHVTRTVRIPRRDNRLIVTDELRNPSETPVSATVLWNLGCDVKSVKEDSDSCSSMIKYIVTTKKGRRLKLEIDVSGALRDGVTHELVKGQNNPMRGWYSPILYVRRPSYAIAVEVRFTGSVRVETRIDKAPRRYFPGLRILIKGY